MLWSAVGSGPIGQELYLGGGVKDNGAGHACDCLCLGGRGGV